MKLFLRDEAKLSQMTSSLLKTIASEKSLSSISSMERALAAREQALEDREKQLARHEQDLLQQQERVDTLELRVHILQQQDEQRRAAKRIPQNVGTQTDGGLAAKQMDDEHRSSLRAELTRHRAQLDSINEQMAIEGGALERCKNELAAVTDELDQQKLALGKSRVEARELDVQLADKAAELQRYEQRAATAQKVFREMEERIKELQGEEGTLMHKRVVVDTLTRIEAELEEKQRLLQEAAAQLGAASAALDADVELAQRRAALASLVPLQEKLYAMQVKY